jgi:hypothetical protein
MNSVPLQRTVDGTAYEPALTINHLANLSRPRRGDRSRFVREPVKAKPKEKGKPRSVSQLPLIQRCHIVESHTRSLIAANTPGEGFSAIVFEMFPQTHQIPFHYTYPKRLISIFLRRVCPIQSILDAKCNEIVV